MNRDRPGKDLRTVEIFRNILYTYIIHKVWNHAIKRDISWQMIKEVYLASLEPSAAWHDSEPLICTSVVPETPNIATFSFSSASGAWFSFKAGQFLRLALPVGGEIVNRVYTACSPPSRPLSLSVTVKAQEGSIEHAGCWIISGRV